jgi:hypothetical protein
MTHLSAGALIFVITTLLFANIHQTHKVAYAQNSGDGWSEFVNISKTSTASTYPCIVADSAGNVHVLWSEDVNGKTSNLQLNTDGSPLLDSRGNKVNYLTETGNTLFYTRWDGNKWLDPIDVQINPGGRIQYPQASVDLQGILHVVWVATEGENARLYYSQAQASKAESVQEWTRPTVLAENILYASYPVDIATDVTGGIHVLFSRIGDEPGAYVINSDDGGKTWSNPVELYRTYDSSSTLEGISHTRLIVDKKGRLHATLTRYGSDGNGKGIYYLQSQDLGRTWSKPFEVAIWQPGWYEVDWLSVGVAGDDIHLVWEGSSSIAFVNERISNDGGVTWNAPHQILAKLRGANGFPALVTDSANQLHMLYVQRGDPDSISQGIWYTSWNKDHWQDPYLIGSSNYDIYAAVDKLPASSLRNMMRGVLTGNGLRYVRSTVVNGNELFTIVVNEWDGEIWSSHMKTMASAVKPRPYDQLALTPPQVTIITPQQTSVTEIVPIKQINQVGRKLDTNIGDPILIGSIPVVLLVMGTLLYVLAVKRIHS